MPRNRSTTSRTKRTSGPLCQRVEMVERASRRLALGALLPFLETTSRLLERLGHAGEHGRDILRVQNETGPVEHEYAHLGRHRRRALEHLEQTLGLRVFARGHAH